MSEYRASISRSGPWWIGWIEEVPGVNSQGATREELVENLRSALGEAIDVNDADIRVRKSCTKSRKGNVVQFICVAILAFIFAKCDAKPEVNTNTTKADLSLESPQTSSVDKMTKDQVVEVAEQELSRRGYTRGNFEIVRVSFEDNKWVVAFNGLPRSIGDHGEVEIMSDGSIGFFPGL